MTIDAITGAQKAAVLILSVGKEQAARILRNLREAEVTEIMVEVARLQNVDQDVLADVLTEFSVIAEARTHLAQGGVDVARELLEESVGRAKAAEIFESLSLPFVAAPFEFLRRADPRQVLRFIQDEHPQTIALVLAHMNADAAALVLGGLAEQLQSDVAVRVATMDRTSPAVIEAVEASLEKRLASVLQQGDLSSAGGVKSLVEILNRSDRATERLIFESLETYEEDLAEEVRNQMFVFEDIAALEDRSVQLLLRQVDQKDLAMALKGVRVEVRTKILSNVSARAQETLLDDIEQLGAVRLKSVEEAQANIVRSLRALEETGQIVVRRSSDEYVS
ncbi:MAG: flagellar motor switch protein FliG [Acidimicrobiia bacterium]|nr:flagellar motor switch protein FliG [Acidimicrobiia bacterium]